MLAGTKKFAYKFFLADNTNQVHLLEEERVKRLLKIAYWNSELKACSRVHVEQREEKPFEIPPEEKDESLQQVTLVEPSKKSLPKLSVPATPGAEVLTRSWWHFWCEGPKKVGFYVSIAAVGTLLLISISKWQTNSCMPSGFPF